MAAAEPMRVLFVGAGVSTAAAVRALRASEGASSLLDVHVWDKARQVGGRFATASALDIATRGDGKEDNGGKKFARDVLVDTGMQYLTNASGEHKELYSELEATGIIVPMSGKVIGQSEEQERLRNFVAPGGARSVVQAMLGPCDVQLSRQLAGVSVVNTGPEGAPRWRVSLNKESTERLGGDLKTSETDYDALVLSMPAPQVEALAGAEGALHEALAGPAFARAHSASFSSRFALGLFYSDSAEVAAALETVMPSPTWGWYVGAHESECVRFISVDTAKRGSTEPGLSLLVHTSVPFGISNLEKPNDEISRVVLEHTLKLLPGLPTADVVKVHRWRYSQSRKHPADSSDMLAAAASDGKPALVLCGDSYSGSGFDNTVRSGIKAAAWLAEKAGAKL